MSHPRRKTRLLLAARAGLWRNALESFLKAMPELEVHAEVENLGEMEMFLDQHPTETLLLEAALCGDCLTQTLASLFHLRPDLNLIVITDTSAQYRAAETAGAGRILMKSMLHQQLEKALVS